MKIEKAERRDAKLEKRRTGMRVSGRTTKTLIPEMLAKRSREARKKRREVEAFKDTLAKW